MLTTWAEWTCDVEGCDGAHVERKVTELINGVRYHRDIQYPPENWITIGPDLVCPKHKIKITGVK